MSKKLTQELVKDLFTYSDGKLYWNMDRGKKTKRGDIAGYKAKIYFIIKINGDAYRQHRVIFLYHKGFMPEYLDHEDGNVENNRIGNLRECTSNQNNQN